MQKH